MHDPGAFAIERTEVRGVELAFVREGRGGFPLVLLHGWPETKRIWWRNVAPLAAAGFEVIAPDLRGFGDSGPAPDGQYDIVSSARDVEALVRALGHERCVVCAGDFGGAIAYDLSLRFPGLVARQVLFNTVSPFVADALRAAGIPLELGPASRMAADYFRRQGREADALCAELRSDAARRRYVAGMYGHRFWAAPGAFDRADVDFMTEPFADAERFRRSIAIYEHAAGAKPAEAPLLDRPNPTPTLVLYGPEDHVIARDFPHRMAVALPERVGPFWLPGAGHFLQWERAEELNAAMRYFCLDLLASAR